MLKNNNWEFNPENSSEDLTNRTGLPILATIVMTNYGIWFKNIDSEAFSKKNDEYWLDYNNEFLDNWIIPISSIYLYYVSFKCIGNIEIELQPSQLVGYKDKTPRISIDEQLKLIIFFTHIVKKDKLQEIIRLEQPIKLKLTVFNEKGKDDFFATARLYELIYEKIKENYVYEDESWMYHSRPMYW
jgi:hypothetical protein